MDRNKDWERTKRAYEAMVRGKGCGAKSAEEAITQAYNRGETDEFICPTIIKKDGGPTAVIKDNDAIFFFNLRSDRARQITKTFVQPNFKEANQDSFHRVDLPKNIRFVAMTDFGPDLPNILTAFPSRDVENSLTQILCPRRQMYVAESEKFAHITYFFNGGYAQHFCDERWVKISSPEVSSYEEKPKMSAKKIADYAISGIESGEYEFIAINFANPDMVGHTGNLKAGKIAVNEVDTQAERVLKSILKTGAQAIITADHGNVEEMINLKTKEIDTEHSINPVPYFIVSSRLNIAKKLRSGKLADVAPMILKMMNIPKPKEMTGNSLF
jgi:2,3-bisphosphoglycerate-independent phosphoglycerate mutase